MAADEIVLIVEEPGVIDTINVTLDVKSDVVNVMLSEQRDVLELVSVEERGPVGPTGATGQQGVPGVPGQQGIPGETPKTGHVHRQDVPSATWTIVHDLPFRPNISVEDSAGTPIYGGEVTRLDATTLIVSFAYPFGGQAFLS